MSHTPNTLTINYDDLVTEDWGERFRKVSASTVNFHDTVMSSEVCITESLHYIATDIPIV